MRILMTIPTVANVMSAINATATERPTVSRSGCWLSSAEFLLTWFSLVSVTAECVSVISVVRTTELLVVPSLSHSETSYTCFIEI